MSLSKLIEFTSLHKDSVDTPYSSQVLCRVGETETSEAYNFFHTFCQFRGMVHSIIDTTPDTHYPHWETIRANILKKDPRFSQLYTQGVPLEILHLLHEEIDSDDGKKKFFHFLHFQNFSSEEILQLKRSARLLFEKNSQNTPPYLGLINRILTDYEHKISANEIESLLHAPEVDIFEENSTPIGELFNNNSYLYHMWLFRKMLQSLLDDNMSQSHPLIQKFFMGGDSLHQEKNHIPVSKYYFHVLNALNHWLIGKLPDIHEQKSA